MFRFSISRCESAPRVGRRRDRERLDDDDNDKDGACWNTDSRKKKSSERHSSLGRHVPLDVQSGIVFPVALDERPFVALAPVRVDVLFVALARDVSCQATVTSLLRSVEEFDRDVDDRGVRGRGGRRRRFRR